MPKIKFTAATIKNLKPSTSYVEYYNELKDHGSGSLGLRVSPKGKKSWFVLYRNSEGKQKRYRLGAFPQMSLKEANIAHTYLNIHQGGDPLKEDKKAAEQQNADKIAKDNRPTMSNVWDLYVEERSNSTKAQSTSIEEDRKWKMHLGPEFGETPVVDISRKAIKTYLKSYAKKSPVAANRLHSLLSVVLAVACDEELIENHPMFKMKKPAVEVARSRVLTDEEIKTLWLLLEDQPANARDTMRMMLLTAQRKSEIFSIHWNDIDLENSTWVQKRNKTKKTILVPLSPQVLNIVSNRQWTDTVGWVFLSVQDERKHVTDVKKIRIKLNELMGTTDDPWTEHDLRRTARTLMSRLNIKEHVRERVLNHSQGGVKGVYDQYDYLDEKRIALTKLANLIDTIVGNTARAPGKVIQMVVG